VLQESKRFTAHGIPHSLAPFLQEYDIENLDPQRAKATLIERTLRYGSREELRWLFQRFGEAAVAAWVCDWGRYGLPPAQLAFWRLVLGLKESE
jgi:hypothetical protein